MRRRLALMIATVLAMSLVACGEDDVSGSGQAAAERASEIAQETQRLAREVAERGRAVIEDPGGREQAVEDLRRLEAQAREQARRAGDLPSDVGARNEIRSAAEDVALAAERLQAEGRSAGAPDTQDARDRLQRAQDQLTDAAGQLEGSLPEEARRALDDLREQAPSLP